MEMTMPLCKPARLALALLLFLPNAAHAAPSTSEGRISVQQVSEMLERAPTDPAAAQLLTAYLAGVGEAAAGLLDFAQDAPLAICAGRMQMSATTARAALSAGAGPKAQWNETAATPILLRDMLQRANCRLAK
jgi:hypothetical protein